MHPASRPAAVEIEFPDGALYTFNIRPSFWKNGRGCHEFVDAQEQSGTRPVKLWAVQKSGYNVTTKGSCTILGIVLKRNSRLKLLHFH